MKLQHTLYRKLLRKAIRYFLRKRISDEEGVCVVAAVLAEEVWDHGALELNEFWHYKDRNPVINETIQEKHTAHKVFSSGFYTYEPSNDGKQNGIHIVIKRRDRLSQHQ